MTGLNRFVVSWRPLLAGGILIGLSGCSQHSLPSDNPPPAQRVVALSSHRGAIPSAVLEAQSSPLYHQAQQDYRRHQFQEALRLLDQLGASPGLSPDALAFCQRQRSLCLSAAGIKTAAPLARTASLSSPPVSPAQTDCGPRALALICQRLGVSASVAQLRQLAGTTARGTSMAGLAKAAKSVGLKAEGVQVSREALGQVEMPALAWVNQNHYVALLSVQGDGEQARATLHDPNKAGEETIDREKLLQRSEGYLLLIHR
jgi:hypothetical protein